MQSLAVLLLRARLRRNLLRLGTTSAVVAISLLSLLAIQGISHSTSDSLVSYSLSKLPAGEQNLTINSSQVISSRAQYDAITKYLNQKLAGISGSPITPEAIYRELSDVHGVRFYFGTVDGLGAKVRLTSGRLPQSCTPTSCEVVQVGGDSKVPPRPASFGLTIVGRAQIVGAQLFAGTMGPPAETPLLLSDGISSGTSLSTFANTHGSDAWVQKIDVGRINQLGTEAFTARVVAFEDQLSIDYPDLILTWPQDAIGSAGDQAVAVASKLTLLSFAVVTLLLAFLALVTIRERKDHLQFRAALSRIGTPKRSIALELYGESFAPIVFGALLTGALSFVMPTVLSHFNFHAGVTDLYSGWPRYILVGAVAGAMCIGLTIARESGWRRTEIVTLVLVLGLFGWYLQQNHVSDQRYLLIPFFYAAGPVLLCYLALRLIVSLWRKRKRQVFILLKEFFTLWQGVAAMLALTAILAMLSLGYSSGLSQQVIAQAQNQVPLDLSLKTGSTLIRPLDLASVNDYAGLQVGSSAYPVLRTGTSIRGTSSTSDTLSQIGLPSAALALADPALSALSKTSAFDGTQLPAGFALGSTRSVSVTLSGIPPEIDLLGWFRTPRGTHISATFAGQADTRTLQLSGVVPTGSSLVAFEFRESSNYLSRRLHAIGEGDYSVPELKGVGGITQILFDSTPQNLITPLWHFEKFSYAFDGQSIYLQPDSASQIPAVVTDPTTASFAVNGVLTLLGSGNTYTQVKVGAVTKSFPSAGDRFVIMGLGAMQSEIAKSDLGAIDPIEIWIKSQNPDGYVKKLVGSAYQGLSVQSRLQLERDASADPNNVGLLGSYRVALTLAILISLLVALGVLPLIYREGSGVLTELEVVGYGPTKLRAALRFTWRISTLVGLSIGTVLGIVIARAFISPSIPYLQEAVVLVSSFLIIEVAGRVISRSFFRELLPVI